MTARTRRYRLWTIFFCWALLGASPGDAEDGLAFDSPRLHPGKLDFLYSYNDSAPDQVNLIWWSPVFKGGLGLFERDQADDTFYAGGFLRPLQGQQGAGELIIGAQITEQDGIRQSEAQAEYRLPSGFGFGAGLVERENSDLDIRFAKISYRNQWQRWRAVVSIQVQEVGEESSPGGYVALYDEKFMITYGNDGEQWRSAIGFVSPARQDSAIRPAFEVLYVDNTVGDLAGPQFLFANASLGFRGGFLSHPARLGRAMGPTGMEFGNPLGFLNPTFNRRLNTWELGGIADFRLVRLDLPNGLRRTTWEAVLFPTQLDAHQSIADRFYLGAQLNDSSPGEENIRGLVGYQGPAGFTSLGLRLEYDFDNDEANFFLGIIDFF